MDIPVRLPEATADIASALRQAMANVAASVSVLTVRNEDRTLGVTISSLISLSLDPPLVLFALHAGSILLARLEGAQFGITVLAADQREIATIFSAANRPSVPDAWLDDAEADSLILRDGAAGMLAHTEVMHGAGDHVVVIGRVMSARTGNRPPLIHHQRSYGEVTVQDHRLGAPRA